MQEGWGGGAPGGERGRLELEDPDPDYCSSSAAGESKLPGDISVIEVVNHVKSRALSVATTA